MGKIKLNLGCGDDRREEYINIDLYSNNCDVKMDIAKLQYEDNYVDEILSYHVIEHVDFQQAARVLAEWYRVLKHGGRLHLETPDCIASFKAFIEGDEHRRTQSVSLYAVTYSANRGNQAEHIYFYGLKVISDGN